MAAGIDPSEARKAAKAARGGEDSFEAVAREWHAKHAPRWAPGTPSKIIGRLERDVFPSLGARPVGEVTAPELLAVLRRIEARGAIETAHRAHQNCGRVFRYAIATGRAERNPAPIFVVRYHRSRRSTTRRSPSRRPSASCCAPSTAIRGTSLPNAPCAWPPSRSCGLVSYARRNGGIDLDAAEWRIPAERMKMRAIHIVPLSDQALAILRELHPLTGSGRYVFPGLRTPTRPMSKTPSTQPYDGSGTRRMK